MTSAEKLLNSGGKFGEMSWAMTSGFMAGICPTEALKNRMISPPGAPGTIQSS